MSSLSSIFFSYIIGWFNKYILAILINIWIYFRVRWIFDSFFRIRSYWRLFCIWALIFVVLVINNSGDVFRVLFISNFWKFTGLILLWNVIWISSFICGLTATPTISWLGFISGLRATITGGSVILWTGTNFRITGFLPTYVLYNDIKGCCIGFEDIFNFMVFGGISILSRGSVERSVSCCSSATHITKRHEIINIWKRQERYFLIKSR